MSSVVEAIHVVVHIARVEHAVTTADIVLHPMILGITVILHEVGRISSRIVYCYSHIDPSLQKSMG